MNESNDKELIPHIAVITINGIVHQQLPNGQYHPRRVYNDSFSIILKGNNEEDCIADLKAKLDKIKEIE